MKAPRIGLYMSYQASMDEGWTRWLFDEFGFSYTTLHDADVQSGNLRQRFDAIVIPDQPAQQIAQGHRAGIDAAGILRRIGDERRGRAEAVHEPRRHADLSEPRLGLRDRGSGREGEECIARRGDQGFLLARLTAECFARYQEPAGLWHAAGGHAVERTKPDVGYAGCPEAHVVARYPSAKVLASGWLLGEKYLVNRAALLDVAAGPGPHHPVRHAAAVSRAELSEFQAVL